MSQDWQNFRTLVNSLKLYSKHSFDDSAMRDLDVEDLYIDPTGTSIQTVRDSKFSLILGRKGTGKSILFDLSQKKINDSNDQIAIYVNCQSLQQEYVYDISTQVDTFLSKNSWDFSEKQLEEYFYRRSFIERVLAELINQIKSRVESSLSEKIKAALGISKLKEMLDQLVVLVDSLKNPNEREAGIIRQALVKTSDQSSNKETESYSDSIGGNLGLKDISIQAEANQTETKETGNASKNTKEYSAVFVQVFRPREIFKQIFEKLGAIGIDKLYIFLDDFSELNEDYQEILCNSVLSQIHQWSEYKINISIAGYPTRTYLGALDVVKIEKIRLDFEDVFAHLDFPKKHIEARNFINRILEKRLAAICKKPYSNFFEEKDYEDILKELFQSSYCAPRAIGKILEISLRMCLQQQKKISSTIVRKASEEYYAGNRLFFDKTNQYKIRESDLPFRSPLEALSQLELLDKIVEEQKNNQTRIAKTRYEAIYGKTPPVSHFHITAEYEKYIDFLRINYFINKVGHLSVKADKDMASVYALNAGLCSEQRINYWEPGDRDERDYLKERFFHFDQLFNEFLTKTKKIVCISCGATFPFSEHDAIASFKWRCRSCDKGNSCEVVEELIDKSKIIKNTTAHALPETELKMISAIDDLEKNEQPTFPKTVAAETDYSYQLVSRRMEKLKDAPYELISIDVCKDDQGRSRKIYKLTDKAKGSYF